MPRIAELREIDGDIWARIPRDLIKSTGSISLMTPEEINEIKRVAYHTAVSAMDEALEKISEDFK